MTYHFKECGLDNVFLTNGYTEIDTAYGKAVSIEAIPQLHQAIAMSIVDQESGMNGAELRYLRKEMDLTQGALAGIMGETEQNIARWERRREDIVRGPADRLMRIVYNDYLNGDGATRRLIDKIANMDAQIAKANISFHSSPEGWEQELQAA